MRVYSAAEVHDALPWEPLAQALRRAFARGASVPLRPAHALSPDDTLLLMPAWDDRYAITKLVTVIPGAAHTVQASVVVLDRATGAPLAFLDGEAVTLRRTAATSALAARALARKNSRVMALIGNGAQSEFQAIAFRDLVGIRELRLFDVDARASAKLAANLAGLGLDIKVVRSTAEAVRGADIVTTVTADKNLATIITPAMVEPGMHFNAVGGDCPGKTELHRGVLEAASVFVEFEPQTRIEGDIQQMPAEFPVTEFWRVLTGAAAGRRSSAEVTVFDSVGFALEDYSALTFVRDAAAELGIGDIIELVPQSADPKNLFGVLRTAPVRYAEGMVESA
jgi:ornithine cyclodeaminase